MYIIHIYIYIYTFENKGLDTHTRILDEENIIGHWRDIGTIKQIKTIYS